MLYDVHSKSCLAAALISVVENWRDAEDISQLEFRIAAQDNTFFTEADAYLTDGTVPCRCHVAVIAEVKERHRNKQSLRANDYAAAACQNGKITPDCYVQIVRYLEGRASSIGDDWL